MEYHGKLYGKIGRKYIPLRMTSEEVDALKSQLDAAEENKKYGWETARESHKAYDQEHDLLIETLGALATAEEEIASLRQSMCQLCMLAEDTFRHG